MAANSACFHSRMLRKRVEQSRLTYIRKTGMPDGGNTTFRQPFELAEIPAARAVLLAGRIVPRICAMSRHCLYYSHSLYARFSTARYFQNGLNSHIAQKAKSVPFKYKIGALQRTFYPQSTLVPNNPSLYFLRSCPVTCKRIV